MRDKKSDLCPRCNGVMRVLDGRERTVPGGTWYELACPRCLHRAYEFRPRRRIVVR